MYSIAVLASVALILGSSVDYARLTWMGKIDPVPAAWILLTIMSLFAGWMYWENPEHTLTGNVGVVASFFCGIIISLGIIAKRWKDNTLSVTFDRAQRISLIAGLTVVVLWFLVRQLPHAGKWTNLVAYVLIQLIGAIGYTVTIVKLWRSWVTKEPLRFWLVALGGNLCAVYPAWVKHDVYSWIYLVRAVPCITLLIGLILWIQYHPRTDDTPAPTTI